MVTPFDLTKLSFRQQKNIIPDLLGSVGSLIGGMHMRADGRKLYVADFAAVSPSTIILLREFDLAVPFDVSTLSGPVGFLSLFGLEAENKDFDNNDWYISPNGLNLYITGTRFNGDIYQYSLSTPHRISTASFVRRVATVGTIFPVSITMKPDGTRMYLTDRPSELVYMYNLSTPFNVATQGLIGTYSLDSAPNHFSQLSDIEFSPDGTLLFEVELLGNRLSKHVLTTPWDVTTASFSGQQFNVVSQTAIPTGLAVSGDGFHILISDVALPANIYEYRITDTFTTQPDQFQVGAKLVKNGQIKPFNINALLLGPDLPPREILAETWDGYPLGSIFDKRDNTKGLMRFDGQEAGPRGWTVMKTYQHTSHSPRGDGPPSFTSGPVWEIVDDSILGTRALKMQMDATMTKVASNTVTSPELGQTIRMENIPVKFRYLSMKARLEDNNTNTRVGFAIRFNARNGEGRNGGTIAVRRIWLNGSNANTSHDDLKNLSQGSYDFNTNVDLGLGNGTILDLENFDIRSLFGGDYYSWTLILYSSAFDGSGSLAAVRHKCDVRWGKITVFDELNTDKVVASVDAILKEPEKHEFSLNAKLIDWHDDLGAAVNKWTSTTGQILAPDPDDSTVHGTGGISYPDLPKAAITRTASPGATKVAYASLPPVNRFDNNFAFQCRLWNHQQLGNFALPVWMALAETTDGVLTGTVQNKIYVRQTALNFREFVMFIVATDDNGNTISGSGRLHYPAVSDVWCRVEVRQNTAKIMISRDPTFKDQMISNRTGLNEAVDDIVDISAFNGGTGKFNSLNFVQTTAGTGGGSRIELYPSNVTNMTVERIAPVVFSIDAIITRPSVKRFNIDAFIQAQGALKCEGIGIFHQDDFNGTGDAGWDNNTAGANTENNIQIDSVFVPNKLNLRFLLPTDFGIFRAFKALDRPGKIDEDFVWEFKHRHYRPGTSAFNQFNSETQISLKETGTNHIVGFNGVVGARAPVFGFNDGTTNTQFSIPNSGGVSDETMIRYRTDAITSTEDPAPGSIGGLAHGPNDLRLEVFDKDGINSVFSPSFVMTLQDNGNTGFNFFPRITKTGNKIKLELFVDEARTTLASVGNGLIDNGDFTPTPVVEVDVTGFDFSQELGFIYIGNFGLAIPTGGSAVARQASEEYDDIFVEGANNIDSLACIQPAVDAIIIVQTKQTRIKEFIIDGSIQKTFGRGMTADARLFGRSGESGGIPPQEPEVDSLIKRLGENGTEGAGLKSFGIEALISDDGIKFTCVDALFPNPGLVEDYFINSLIQSSGDNGNNGGDDIDQGVDDGVIVIPIGTLVGQRLTLATTPLRIITLKFTLHRDGLSGGATGTLTGKIYRNSVQGNAILGADLIATSTNFVSVSSLTTSATGTEVSFSFTGLAETTPNNDIFLGFDVSGSNEQLFLHTESTGTAISGGDVTVESPSGFWGGNLGVDATFEMIVSQVVKNRGGATMNTFLLAEQTADFEINAVIVRADTFGIDAIIVPPAGPSTKTADFFIDADINDPFATSSFESVVGP